MQIKEKMTFDSQKRILEKHCLEPKTFFVKATVSSQKKFLKKGSEFQNKESRPQNAVFGTTAFLEINELVPFQKCLRIFGPCILGKDLPLMLPLGDKRQTILYFGRVRLQSTSDLGC